MKKPQNDIETLSAETAIGAHAFKNDYARFSAIININIEKAYFLGQFQMKQKTIDFICERVPENYGIDEKQEILKELTTL